RDFSKKDAALFIRHFDQDGPRMERIIYELQKISVDKINITDKSKATTTLGAVITGTGAVLALGAAPFTGGLSLAIAGIGAASSVAGGLTIAGGSINEKTMLEELLFIFISFPNAPSFVCLHITFFTSVLSFILTCTLRATVPESNPRVFNTPGQ
uniref:Uncharacterized protein n=1 Tax=Monopterus albus TaxID=43700 RepID=A0A3Q3K8W1_MONAL